MWIKSIYLNNFRNIKSLEIELNKGFNLIYGENGSGKSSFLESIYILGRGRSFRTSKSSQTIMHNHNDNIVRCITTDGNNEDIIACQRSNDGKTTIKCNGESAKYADCALKLPMLMIDTDTHRRFAQHSKERRRLIDWGAFHTEPNLAPWSITYNKALANRNKLLKTNHTHDEMCYWTNLLVGFGQKIHEARANYIKTLEPQFNETKDLLLDNIECNIDYHRGWPDNMSLDEAMDYSLKIDQKVVLLHMGPIKQI